MIKALYKIAAGEAGRFNVQAADRDDLIQEAVIVMIQALQKIEAGRSDVSQRAFLKRAARNAMCDHLRRGSRHKVEEFADEPMNQDTPFDDVVAIETSERLSSVFRIAARRMSPRELSLFRSKLYGESDPELDSLHSGTRGVYSVRARKKLSAVSGEKKCQDIADDSDFAVLFRR